MHEYKTTIKLHQTDAGGVLFFSRQLELMHNAYEEVLQAIGFGFPALLREKDYFLPVVHAEADYKTPISVGDRIVIEVGLEKVATTSFTFTYTIRNDKGDVVGTGKTVHVTVDRKTRLKIPLPADMRGAIEGLK